MNTRSRKIVKEIDKDVEKDDRGRKRKEPETKAEEPKTEKIEKTEKKSDEPSEENLECGICYEKITVQGKPNACDHIFCFPCLQTWAKTANVCPMCKRDFQRIEKKDVRI
jgi:hypothetical protein